MRDDIETLRARINRLKGMIHDCTATRGAPEPLMHILQTAPKLFKDLEATIRTHDYHAIRQVAGIMGQVEANVEMAVRAVKGKVLADDLSAGKGVDPSQPADTRLSRRLTKFMMPRMNAPLYTALVREFAGEDAVQGGTIRMDPHEVDAFSDWMIFDIALPGDAERVIDLFAKSEMDSLPSDEQTLLRARLKDRPSIYEVARSCEDIDSDVEKGTYVAQNLLAPGEVIWIRDSATSKSLQKGAVFIARPIPCDGREDLFSLFGSVGELPPRLWDILSPTIEKWRQKHLEECPASIPFEFFRTHHARLRREILDIMSKR